LPTYNRLPSAAYIRIQTQHRVRVGIGDPDDAIDHRQTGRAVQALRQADRAEFAAAQAQRAQLVVAAVSHPQHRRRAVERDRLRLLQQRIAARAFDVAEPPCALPDQGRDLPRAQVDAADRRAGLIADVEDLLDDGQRAGADEGRVGAFAVDQIHGAGTGKQLQRALAEIVGPDPVVAGGGDADDVRRRNRDPARLVQRHRARIVDHALVRLARASGAAERIDIAGAEFDPSHRMIAGVGDVKRIALQAEALRVLECRQFHRTIDETGAAAAELAMDPARRRALQYPVVAGIDHIQILLIGGDAHRETQRQIGFAIAAQFDRFEIQRLRHFFGAKLGDLRVEFAHRRIADDAVAHAALSVDQHHGRPCIDAVVLPEHPVGVVGDREVERHALQSLDHPLGVALVIEARQVDRHDMQVLTVPFAQGRKVAEPLLAPGGAGVDEGERGDPPAQLPHAQRLGQIQPFEAGGKFGGGRHIHYLRSIPSLRASVNIPSYRRPAGRQPDDDACRRRIDHRPHLAEVVGIAGVGVGNFGARALPGPFQQKCHPRSGASGRHRPHVAQHAAIGAEQPVEVFEVDGAELARALGADIHPSTGCDRDAAAVRRLTGVPASGTGGIHLHPVQAAAVQMRAQGAFGQG
jgi:hypothetical protein